MKLFLDTSVLVAAFWGDHPNHAASLRMLVSATPEEACCAAHSLVELYAVMTRLPVRPMVPPDQALLFVQEAIVRLSTIALDGGEYATALEDAARRGIAGGRMYDALLLHCARKAGAERILTWNVSDFRRIAPDLTDRIISPEH